MKDLFNFDPGKIPVPEFPSDKPLVDGISNLLKNLDGSPGDFSPREESEISQEWLRGMVKIATNAWRAMSKMTDPFSGEVKKEFQTVAKPVEGILRGLSELGFEIKGHTGEPYDEGQYLKVIVAEPTTGTSRPKVKETYKPTIYYKSKILQPGEVVVAIAHARETFPKPSSRVENRGIGGEAAKREIHRTRPPIARPLQNR